MIEIKDVCRLGVYMGLGQLRPTCGSSEISGGLLVRQVAGVILRMPIG